LNFARNIISFFIRKIKISKNNDVSDNFLNSKYLIDRKRKAERN